MSELVYYSHQFSIFTGSTIFKLLLMFKIMDKSVIGCTLMNNLNTLINEYYSIFQIIDKITQQK